MSYSIKDLQSLLDSNPDVSVIPERPRPAIDERNMLLSDYAVQHGGYVPVESSIETPAGLSIPVRNEFELQTAVVNECALRALTNPLYQLLLAIPNGQYRPGQRMEPGLKKGVPDLFLPVPRHSRHGLFVELKVKPNKQTADQLWWERRLRVEGYCVECIWDKPQDAINTIEWYLEK